MCDHVEKQNVAATSRHNTNAHIAIARTRKILINGGMRAMKIYHDYAHLTVTSFQAHLARPLQGWVLWGLSPYRRAIVVAVGESYFCGFVDCRWLWFVFVNGRNVVLNWDWSWLVWSRYVDCDVNFLLFMIFFRQITLSARSSCHKFKNVDSVFCLLLEC